MTASDNSNTQSNTTRKLSSLLTYITVLPTTVVLSGCEFTNPIDTISNGISSMFQSCLIFLVCVFILPNVILAIIKLISKAHKGKKIREKEDARFEREMQIEEQRLNMQMRQLEYQTQQQVMSMKSNQRQNTQQSTSQQPTTKQQVGQQIDLRATGFSNNDVTGGD